MQFSFSVLSFSYTAPTALGIKQRVEKLGLKFFYLTFLNVSFIFATFLRFKKNLERFFTCLSALYLRNMRFGGNNSNSVTEN